MSDKPDETKQADDKAAPGLEEAAEVPTSRIGRFLKTGWAARHAVPLAVKRTAELVSAKKEDRGEQLEKLLKEQEAVAEELFRTLGTLKGVVQKFGQQASYLEGLLPAEVAPVYQKVLSRLQDAAPALPPLASQSVIEDELDCFIEDHFQTFEEQPFAAASIGQVHRATLYDGTKVAVKVQYPNIDKAFQSDLKNIKMLEMLFAPVVRYYRSKDTLELLRQQLLDELDYEREANAQERFAAMFKDHPRVRIPRVFRELSTKKILVTEYVEGMSFDEVCASDHETRLNAALALVHYYVGSMHIHAFTNVDPHPGNYVFHEDGRVSFLDFGAAVPLERDVVDHLTTHAMAIVEQDMATLHEEIHYLFGLPKDAEPIMLEAYAALVLYCLAPLNPNEQPFQFSSEWVGSCFEEGMSAAKQILLRGGKLPKLPPPPEHIHPDMAAVYRIVLGLGSLLSRLGAQTDWCVVFRDILAEAQSKGTDEAATATDEGTPA